MIDLVLSQENEELQALVTLLEDQPTEEREDFESARYDSGEESYDSIFLEILSGSADKSGTDSISNVDCTGNDTEARVDTEAMDTTC